MLIPRAGARGLARDPAAPDREVWAHRGPSPIPGIPFSPSAAIFVCGCSGQQGRVKICRPLGPALGKAREDAPTWGYFLLGLCNPPATSPAWTTDGKERPGGQQHGKVGISRGFGASLSWVTLGKQLSCWSVKRE